MKKHFDNYNSDTAVFSESIEVVVDDMRDYLESMDYTQDQVDELTEQLTDILECAVSEFLDDIVEPDEGGDEEEDDG